MAEGWSPPAGTLPLTGRGIKDSEAAWRRWHRNARDDLFRAHEWPWYVLLESARVAILASRDLPGMATNLAPRPPELPSESLSGQMYRLAMTHFASPQAANAETTATAAFINLPNPTPVPAQARGRWRWLWRRETVPGQPDLPTPEHISTELQAARRFLDDETAFAERVRPLVEALAAALPAGSPGSQQFDNLRVGQDSSVDPESAVSPAEDGAALDSVDGSALKTELGTQSSSYRIFSRRWDQEVFAERLVQAGDYPGLSSLPEVDRLKARRLALELRRRLMAARLSAWSFDREDGLVDSRRLSRLISGDPPYRIFREELNAPIPEACVTLLVDQSGSMRGKPQQLTALALDLAAQTLDDCRIPCEILGYTTRFGADNPMTAAWKAAGQPAQPGRLNALLHVIYKTPRQPWRNRRRFLGLLLQPGLGRENLDGEAIAWAAGRLLRQPESRKILVVLSDGKPHDEATVAANGRGLLEDHLHEVIAGLRHSAIQICAIGAGQDAGRFYPRTLALDAAGDAAAALFQHLGDLLISPDPSRKTRS